jgi:hypothetical protein
MTRKDKLLAGTADVENAKTKAKSKVKGKSAIEADVERKNRGNKPESVAQKPRDARADSAQHEHDRRHGDRSSDADTDSGENDGAPYRLRGRELERLQEEGAQQIATIGIIESLADDLLRGAAQISAFIGLDLRQTFHALQQGHIPATKEGKTWVGSKSRLRKHYGCADGASAEVA